MNQASPIKNSTDLERALVAAALMSPDVFDQVEVAPQDIWDPTSRSIWTAMVALKSRRQQPNDITLLYAELGDKAGSVLSDAMAMRPGDESTLMARSSARQYAEMVIAASLERRVRTALVEAASAPGDGDDVLKGAWERLHQLSARSSSGNDAVPMSQAMAEAIKAIGDAFDGKPAPGVMTGFNVVDRIFGPLPLGTVSLIAGRPSMGKSSFARGVAASAVKAGLGVHVFSHEDTRRVYATRQIADDSGIALERLANGGAINRLEFDRLKGAAGGYQKARWQIDESTSLSSSGIGLRVRRHAKANNTQLVIVDYVQLLKEPGAKAKHEEVSRAAEGLATVAREENVAMLVVSQLSRECDRRDDKRPLMSDLRDSGVLEQIASKVMFCYRPGVYDEHNESIQHIGELIVRKNKNGRVGSAPLHWDAKCATYREPRCQE